MIKDNLGRPSWDLYFMSLAFVVAQRSLDRDTKHGCVVINEDKTVLALGYNGPPRGSIDENVPLTRPEKYPYMVHSELAAIINAARHGIPLKGSIFYITGHPCADCMRSIINVGATKVIYGPVGSHCVPEDTQQIVAQMLIGQPLKLEKFGDVVHVQSLLQTTNDYINTKVHYKDPAQYDLKLSVD
jgi:dCMP deaminase|tara:strand:+ start:1494 stop:2051 length:558 start_codon:yes stop_codon:yes gene_type:complete